MGVYLSLFVEYGIPAILQIGNLIKQEILRQKLEKEKGEKIYYSFMSESQRLHKLELKDLINQ